MTLHRSTFWGNQNQVAEMRVRVVMGKTVSRSKEERRRNTSFREKKWWRGFWVSPNEREEENAPVWMCTGSFILPGETGGRAAVSSEPWWRKRERDVGNNCGFRRQLSRAYKEIWHRKEKGREAGRNINYGRPLWDTPRNGKHKPLASLFILVMLYFPLTIDLASEPSQNSTLVSHYWLIWPDASYGSCVLMVLK